MKNYSLLWLLLIGPVVGCFGQSAESYFKEGQDKLELQDFTGAMVAFNQALALKPDYAEAYCSRANTKVAMKDARGALTDYNKAIELNTWYPQAYNNRGYLKDLLGDCRGAITDYNRAIENDLQYSLAYYNRALSKFRLQQVDSGCMDIKEAGLLGFKGAETVVRKYCK